MTIKCYQVSSVNSWDIFSHLVWAENPSEAKNSAWYEFDSSTWIELRAKRLPSMDDKQDLTGFKRDLLLMEEEGWWFEFDIGRYDEDNIINFIIDSAQGNLSPWYVEDAQEEMIKRGMTYDDYNHEDY